MAEATFQRNTPQRKVILEELQTACTHPTAVELYELVRRRLPKVSLGTVYRNLELLSEAGLARKLGGGASEARFDGDLDVHCHVRCVECDRVHDVTGRPPELAGPKSDAAGGYEILGHRLEFIGICPDCNRRETNGSVAAEESRACEEELKEEEEKIAN